MGNSSRRAPVIAGGLVAVGLAGAAPAASNPVSVWSFPHVDPWLGPIIAGSADLLFDLLVLAVVGWRIGLLRADVNGTFLGWGGRIWVGGIGADKAADAIGGRHYLAMIGVALALIFVWNLFVAVASARIGWRKGLVIAGAVALLTAPYFDHWARALLADL